MTRFARIVWFISWAVAGTLSIAFWRTFGVLLKRGAGRVGSRFLSFDVVPCLACGSREADSVVKDRIDGTACEAEIICRKCRSVQNYWAYGHYESATRYSEYTWRHWWEQVLRQGTQRGGL